MSKQVISAEYTLHGTLISLGKFKTEEKAWKALDIEENRISQEEFDEFDDTCKVIIETVYE